MPLPIILLVGKAGSGKDTVAGLMTKYGGVSIAHADPLKRFAKEVFGFNEEALWGPSHLRDTEVPVGPYIEEPYTDEKSQYVYRWLEELAASGTIIGNLPLRARLDKWFSKYISDKETVSARYVLQSLGTEFARNVFGVNVWPNYAFKTAMELLNGGTYSRVSGVTKSDKPAPFVVITDGRFLSEVINIKKNNGLVVKICSPRNDSGLSGEAAKHASEKEQDGIPENWIDIKLNNNKNDGLGRLSHQISNLMERVILKEPEFF